MTRIGTSAMYPAQRSQIPRCHLCAHIEWLDMVLPVRADLPEGWEEIFCPEVSRCYYWMPDQLGKPILLPNQDFAQWSRPGAARYDGVLIESPCRCSHIPRAILASFDRVWEDVHDPFWEAVLRTHKLTCPTLHKLDQNGKVGSGSKIGSGFSMLRFETRNMAKLDPGSAQARGMFEAFGECESVEDAFRSGIRIHPEASGCFRMYHFTNIANLLSSFTQDGILQDGILQDGKLRFGTLHTDGIGVYVFSHRALWNLSAFGQTVMLEVLCLPFLTHLNQGPKGRYVCKAPAQGPFATPNWRALCSTIQIEAIWMKLDHVPEFMQQFHKRHEMD